MRALHLFSNGKWTGPAEPVVNLCAALKSAGVDVTFACKPDTGASINKVVETARDRGLEPLLDFTLNKHWNPVSNWFDVRAIRAWLRENPCDLVHCHLENDHRIGVAAAGRLGVPIIRSSYEGAGFQNGRRVAPLLRKTAFLIEPSQRALEHDAQAFGFPRERMAAVDGAIDLERFDPSREVPDGRRWLNIPRDAFVVGIVARMQTHRRYEDFWRAMRWLVDAQPGTRVVVVGRGSKQEQVGMQPVRELGLEGAVHFTGFIDGENYVGMLKAFDALVYLVPGSDGTCRTVREAMAMARPVVSSDRGMLPELIDGGETGYVTNGSPQALFESLGRLAADRRLARQLGQAARRKAETRFGLPRQAETITAIYEQVLGAGG